MAVIGGRASTIRELGDGRVLRIGGDPEREARLMQLARAGGFPVPAVHEVRAEGLVLERIPGPTMARAILRRPWRARGHVAVLAGLHEQLHGIPLDDGTLLHLDLHPENVLLSPRGPVVIDWTNARAGDPHTDVALTWLIMRTSAGLPGRLLAWLFGQQVGHEPLRRGLASAAKFRLADPHVTDAERDRVERLLAHIGAG